MMGPGHLEHALLANGTRLTLRPLVVSDAPLLQSALKRLSPRSRYLRFHAPRGEFSPEELRQLSAVDGEQHVALGAFAGRTELVAVGRFVRSQPAETAEVALAVADLHQQSGIGTLLLSRLKVAALERGVRRFAGPVLAENQPMLCLLRKLGARVGLPSWGVCNAELELGDSVGAETRT
jgi:GNAT superfamily N-acetyltransferase